MTSSNDKATNSQKVKKHQLLQAMFTQAQVHISVHSYVDTRFLFIFKNSRRSKHFLARFRLRQHKSPQNEKTLNVGLCLRSWEAGAEMKSSANGARSR